MIKLAEFTARGHDGRDDRYQIIYSTHHNKWWVVLHYGVPVVIWKHEVRASCPNLEEVLHGASRAMEEKIGEVLNGEDLLGQLWDVVYRQRYYPWSDG